MRKVIYSMSVSLDGCIEAADGDLGWADPDEELHRYFNEREQAIDIHLYGRRMYENMSAYWPTAGDNPSAPVLEIEYARLWKEMPKIVFSTTLDRVGWNSRLVKGNIAEEVRRLKAQPGGNMSVSGANIAASLMRSGLIDEYWLYVFPIILGGGKQMFPQLTEQINLELIETRTFDSGVVLLRYQAASGGMADGGQI
jgi:dihydrofolate reductase